MALSLLCGGLGVAEAAVVHVNEDPSGTSAVYTTDETYTRTDIDGKLDLKANAADVNTELAKKADAANVYTRTEVDGKLDLKANAADVNTELAKKANKSDVYSKTDADTTFATKTELNAKADKTDLDTANGKITELQNKTAKLSADGKELKDMTTVSGTTVSGDNVKAGELTVTGEIKDGAGVTTTLAKINDSMTQTGTNTTAINDLDTRTTQISYDPAKGTTVSGVDFTDAEVDAHGKGLMGVSTLNTTGAATVGGALKADSLIVENASNLKGDVTMDKTLNVTGDTTLKGTKVDGKLTVTDDAGLKNTEVNGTLTTTGEATFKEAVEMDKGLTVTSGDTTLKGTKVDGKLTVTDDADLKNTTVGGTLGVTGATTLSGELNAEKNATFEKNVTVEGTTNLKDTTVTGNLNVTGTITTDKMVFGDKPTNYTEIDKGHITSKNAALAGDATQQSSSMEFDRTKLEVGVADKDSNGHLTMTADQTSIKNSDLDGKNYSEIVADKDRVTTTVKDENGNTTSTKSSATEIRNYAGDAAGNKTINLQTATQNKSWAKDKDGNESSIVQTGKDITNTAEKGTITNKAQTIVNNATGDMTNTVGGKQTNTIGGNQENTIGGEQKTTVEGKVTETYKNGQETNVTGDQKTTVTGDILNKAENITNEANTKLTDKVGENTRVLDHDGITDTVGGSTFKQRIDKIMMESKDVSIKAEETLTNEAKVITNKASEVINNEAININNTATGIITSQASEIKNQADKLISNKVGENTWENMEDGKITTSIKDGTKQNLTESNADGLKHAVTDGTSINASATTATSSAQTIVSGGKANSVITTIDGTQFVNSDAAAPVTGASGAGTVDRTTIKGNTITTGKVTMDYAKVMKDLGVNGNANITGKTTTGSLEVKGESKLTGNVTMENNATVGNDLTVKGITNTKTLNVTEDAKVGRNLAVDGNATIAGDVTARSYKVDGKTYIDANGINANDQKITNVADGSISEGSKDAVNGGQLYGVKRDLEHQVDKVGANAAAMANLRPMEFDPSSKWNIAAAIGNYGSETAAALGAFYRPNDDVMVNLSTAFGTGENMVGGGVSVRLGKGSNKLSREESNALKDQVDDLTARMDALLSVLNPNMSKDFPDVPENHWAYEAVSRLAGNDIVQGYPDGEFHGERTMTRYEMAEIIYNALSRGAEAEKELVEEFKPELQAMAASEKAPAEKAEG